MVLDVIEKALAAFGGAVCILTAIAVFGKGILEKYIHTLIEKSASEELEKIKHKLAKNMAAFEVLMKMVTPYRNFQ